MNANGHDGLCILVTFRGVITCSSSVHDMLKVVHGFVHIGSLLFIYSSSIFSIHKI